MEKFKWIANRNNTSQYKVFSRHENFADTNLKWLMIFGSFQDGDFMNPVIACNVAEAEHMCTPFAAHQKKT